MGLVVVEFLWLSSLLWWNRVVSFGSFDFTKVFLVLVAPYLVWVRFHLDGVASRAMDSFRPALSVGDAEFSRLRYELTTLPANVTRIVTLLAVVAYVVNAALLPEWIVAQFGSSRVVSAVMIAPVGFFTLAVVAISTAQAIRQLWMVDFIYGLAANISLFRVKPFYAFSGLAARTGMSFLILAYFIATVRPDIVQDTPILKLIIVATVPTAVACFLLPLYGMHLRLVAEKDRMLAEASSRFETLLARLHQRVDEQIYDDADKLNHQISSVAAEREAISRLSTWPWEASTMTGFVTALVLPVILYVVTRLLGRFGF